MLCILSIGVVCSSRLSFCVNDDVCVFVFCCWCCACCLYVYLCVVCRFGLMLFFACLFFWFCESVSL